MSFILDALKKSENERQRYNGPSLVDTPIRRVTNERPWWAIGLAALLGLNLLVFAFVLLRPQTRAAEQATQVSPPPAAPASAPVQAPATPARAPEVARAPATQDPAPRTEPIARDPAVRSLAEEAGVPDPLDSEVPINRNPDLAAAAAVPDGPPMVRPIEGPATAPVRAEPTAPAARNEVLPTINDITANGSRQIPPMHLDIHVYSTSPAERFVFINMRKYREGEALPEGPLVERIDRDGVVINHSGLRFLMPRQ